MAVDTVASHAASALRESAALNEGAETLKNATDSLNRVTGECTAMCTDTMAAAMESGARTSQLMSELAKSYMEVCGASAVTMAEIGRESFTCRSPADIVALQKKAVQSFTETFAESNKVYGHIFATWSKAFEPLVARVADGPERLFSAMAD